MENVSSRCGKSDNAPRLRFPEFSGEWEEKKIKEFANCYAGATPSTKERKYWENGTIPWLSSGEVNKKHISFTDNFITKIGYDSCSTKMIPANTVVMALAGQGKTRGTVAITEIELCTNQSLASIVTNETVDDKFLLYYLETQYSNLRAISSGDGTRGGLNLNIINEYSVFLSSLPEQKKIAAFFTLLDRRIQKQRQLVERLKTYKRGVSEAIFERKFGFPNKTNWKKIKIENLFSERCERAIGNEELLAVTINGGIQKRNEIQLKDNSSEDKSNYKRVHIGDIAYNTMRMWQGASGVSCYAGIVSPAYTVIALKDKENQCIDFWGHYFKHTNLIRTFQKFSQGLTSDTWNLKYTQLSQINLYVPEYKEQCAIANFLHKFDSKISIEEKKLSQLSMLKNELLHRMFI